MNLKSFTMPEFVEAYMGDKLAEVLPEGARTRLDEAFKNIYHKDDINVFSIVRHPAHERTGIITIKLHIFNPIDLSILSCVPHCIAV